MPRSIHAVAFAFALPIVALTVACGGDTSASVEPTDGEDSAELSTSSGLVGTFSIDYDETGDTENFPSLLSSLTLKSDGTFFGNQDREMFFDDGNSEWGTFHTSGTYKLHASTDRKRHWITFSYEGTGHTEESWKYFYKKSGDAMTMAEALPESRAQRWFAMKREAKNACERAADCNEQGLRDSCPGAWTCSDKRADTGTCSRVRLCGI